MNERPQIQPHPNPPEQIERHPIRLGTPSVMLITAQKPKFAAEIGGENEGLEQKMQELGLTYTPTLGKYEEKEDSYIVYGPTARQAFDLGRMFGQESVVYNQGGNLKMLYTNGPNAGKYNPGLPEYEWFEEEPDDYWTKVPEPEGGGYLRLKFDFDTLHDANLNGETPENDTEKSEYTLDDLRKAVADKLRSIQQMDLISGMQNSSNRSGRGSVEKQYTIQEVQQILAKHIQGRLDAYKSQLRDLRKRELGQETSKDLQKTDPGVLSAPPPPQTGGVLGAGSPAGGLANMQLREKAKSLSKVKKCGQISKCGELGKAGLSESDPPRAAEASPGMTPDTSKTPMTAKPTTTGSIADRLSGVRGKMGQVRGDTQATQGKLSNLQTRIQSLRDSIAGSAPNRPSLTSPKMGGQKIGKSEDFIDLNNPNDPKKRLKNQGKEGTMPQDSAPKKRSEGEGSGGQVTKSRIPGKKPKDTGSKGGGMSADALINKAKKGSGPSGKPWEGGGKKQDSKDETVNEEGIGGQTSKGRKAGSYSAESKNAKGGGETPDTVKARAKPKGPTNKPAEGGGPVDQGTQHPVDEDAIGGKQSVGREPGSYQEPKKKGDGSYATPEATRDSGQRREDPPPDPELTDQKSPAPKSKTINPEGSGGQKRSVKKAEGQSPFPRIRKSDGVPTAQPPGGNPTPASPPTAKPPNGAGGTPGGEAGATTPQAPKPPGGASMGLGKATPELGTVRTKLQTGLGKLRAKKGPDTTPSPDTSTGDRT